MPYLLSYIIMIRKLPLFCYQSELINNTLSLQSGFQCFLYYYAYGSAGFLRKKYIFHHESAHYKQCDKFSLVLIVTAYFQVKENQERLLKAKDFLPPVVSQPFFFSLYLSTFCFALYRKRNTQSVCIILHFHE